MKLLINLLTICFALTLSMAQTSEVIATVSWPQWSTENKVEIYSPEGTLLATIDNGYTLGSNSTSYTQSVNLGNLNNATNYTAIVYDRYGDDWNSGGSLTITSDGVVVLEFDGNFDPNANAETEISETKMFEVKNPSPGTSVFYRQTPTDNREYIEYIVGNLPIIISAPHGGVKQSGQTIGGVSYPNNDSSLPNRSCGTNERDDNTEILVRRIQDQIHAATGGYAHVIINNLHRRKLDPNREQNEATCGNANAIDHWEAYHDFIDQASTSVNTNWGKGLFIDLHGQSHSIPRVELGYNITAAQLNSGNINNVTGTSITNLVADNLNDYDQEQLVRGDHSLGAILHNSPDTFYASQGHIGCGLTSGYRALPSNHAGSGSCDDTKPNNNAYFNGDFYNNERHGSGVPASDGLGGGGTIDGIMSEVNRRVRDLGSPFDNRPNTLEPFAIGYANALLEYINHHYNDFAVFNYNASSYEVTDNDPIPTITGVSSGSFTSSPPGLVIDTSSGTIDVSESLEGMYTITYNANDIGYFTTTQNIEITNNTLSTPDFNTINIVIYPNPAKDRLHIKSNHTINMAKLFNMLGQHVGTFNFNTKETAIDISQLKTGTYTLSLYKNNQLLNTKLIVKN